jgi:exodeoxyribonuclease VIII
MNEIEYRTLDAMNWSTLSAGRQSMAHLHDRLNAPREDKECWALGRAVHTAVLEPGAFDARYAIWCGLDKRTKEGKAAWAKFVESSAGLEILSAEDRDEALKIADAVHGNKDAAALLTDGEAEKPIIWNDEDTGIRCKGRVDFITATTIPDLKTTKNAGPRKFAASAMDYGYFGQLAMYRDGAEATDGKARDCYIIAVETARPYVCQVYSVDASSLEIGRYEYKRLLAAYKEAKASGIWPGYSPRILPLTVPKWGVAAMEKQAENDDENDHANTVAASDPF